MRSESEPQFPVAGARQILCVLGCQKEGFHEGMLPLSARVADALGWKLRASVQVDENLVRTPTLPWLMRTGLESVMRRSFYLADLQRQLESVVKRLRRRMQILAQRVCLFSDEVE